MKKSFLGVTVAMVLFLSACSSTAPTLERGNCENGVYTNNFAGIRFTKPDDWFAWTDEEIAELMGVTQELLQNDGANINPKLLELQMIYDAFVQNPSTGTNVQVIFENLSLVMGGANITEQDYLDITWSQLEALTTIVYEREGDVSAYNICGKEYQGVKVKSTMNEMEMEQYYCVRKQGKYMVNIILTVLGGDHAEDIFSNFSQKL